VAQHTAGAKHWRSKTLEYHILWEAGTGKIIHHSSLGGDNQSEEETEASLNNVLLMPAGDQASHVPIGNGES
jgi:hypothetical protein